VTLTQSSKKLKVKPVLTYQKETIIPNIATTATVGGIVDICISERLHK
jgi:hypothetical protein